MACSEEVDPSPGATAGDGQAGAADALAEQLAQPLFAAQKCFELDPFEAYFLSPSQFRVVAPWVGFSRALSFRKVSPHGPAELDLDGRDAHYWHLLVWDRERQELAGSLRLSLSQWHGTPWDGRCSYLEHCYPGLDQDLGQRGLTYAEIGRTFVAPPYQRRTPVLMVLLQAMVSIPLATGHHHLLGMVSFNHFQHSVSLSRSFLAGLALPPFHGVLKVPTARHAIGALPPADEFSITSWDNMGHLERTLEQRFQEPFRVPILLRRYFEFGNAKVIGLSVAKDFNQITEILTHCDLDALQLRQRRRLVVEDLRPVWQTLSLDAAADG
jgi:hypothetical protein